MVHGLSTQLISVQMTYFGAFVMDFKKDQVLDVFRSLHIIYYVVLRR